MIAPVQEVEVIGKAKRRRFTAKEKLRVLKAADAATEVGGVGAVLRREGLYSSHLTEWRRARAAGELDALTPKKRGRKALDPNPLEKENTELKRALAKAELRAKRAEALVELQKKGIGAVGHPAAEGGRDAMMDTIKTIGPELSVVAACAALGLARATYYRELNPMHGPAEKKASPRALPADERRAVLDVLHEPRFEDLAPAEVYATLLDEGRYLCSERTMYRVLKENQEVRERRAQLRHPKYAAPELLATKPNQLWSWDITKLLGPTKWTYFYLYVVLDVFSRYVVGWLVADAESSALAEKLISEACERQGIAPGQLTIHADRGSSMKSKPVAMLLADLGITKTHSRPHVSNDNPYSEAQFKTLKYRPDFPERFGCIEDTRGFHGDFFGWYNNDHHHTGLGLLTPADVHFGRAEERRAARTLVLEAAHLAHPERFVLGPPTPPALPTAAWINKPKSENGSVIAQA
ncbi:MAG: IS3 family transposase [Myxococcales bacterium]|nr:IS3 family transposase [Myxococcales bacterium]